MDLSKEVFEKEEVGACSCGRKDVIIKYTNSNLSKFDHKNRYFFDVKNGLVENLFRCFGCLKEIDKTFKVTVKA